MKKEELIEGALDMLEFANNENIIITEETQLNEVLSYTDGKGSSTSANVFKGLYTWYLATNNHAKKFRFPSNWINLKVKDFAQHFMLLMLFLFLSVTSMAQLSVQLGTIKTDSKQTAINVGISYVRSLDSIWNSRELYVTGKHSIFTVSPQVRIETGTQDAFSSIEAKMTGLFMSFKTKPLESNPGIILPDVKKAIQTFPISVGAESNNTFSTINAIAEAGWVPWYQSATSNTPQVLKYTKFGIFLQGGYKFKGDSSATKMLGGNADQSAEKVNNALFRSKGSFSIDTKKLVNINGLNVGLVGNADVWYDFINGKFYNKIEAVGRFYLTDGQYFDLLYSKGSGAPNFNQGDQYGVGLTIQF